MQNTWYEILTFFFLYGFLGWVCEVIYAALIKGTFVNRGFLLGPICPIYGIGVLCVLFLTQSMMDRPFSVFVLSVIVTSTVEFLIGYLTEKIMHERLWDYSDSPMNIGGYICLTFSLLWGAGCLGIVYVVHPLVRGFVSLIPPVLDMAFLVIFVAMLLCDTGITLFHALKIDSRMKAIKELSDALEGVSTHIGKELSDGAILIKDKAQESEALKSRYDALINKKNIVQDHLFRAFDHLKTGRYREAYEKIKTRQRRK